MNLKYKKILAWVILIPETVLISPFLLYIAGQKIMYWAYCTAFNKE